MRRSLQVHDEDPDIQILGVTYNTNSIAIHISIHFVEIRHTGARIS